MTDGRVPPYDETAERAVLGAILLDNGVRQQVFATLRPEHFYSDRHRIIYAAMQRLGVDVVDHVTLGAELRAAGELERIGGAITLSALTDAVVTTAAVDTYAQIVRDTATARALIHAAQEVVAAGYSRFGGASFGAWMAAARVSLSGALVDPGRTGGPSQLDADLRRIFDEVTTGREPEGLCKTGFANLDAATGGLFPGIVTVLAGRPSMGKSAVLLNAATNAAMAGQRVLVLSLEDTRRFIALRMLARFANIDLMQLTLRTVPTSRYTELLQGMCRVTDAGLWVDDTSGVSSADIRACIAAHRARHGLDLVIIDHLLEVRDDGENETQRVAAAATGIRDMAKELNIPVLLATQLNRDVEKRADKRPQLSDLKQAGRIEEVARAVWFLYRDGYYRGDDEAREIELIVAKTNHGRTGAVRLWGDLSRMFVRGWDNETDGVFRTHDDDQQQPSRPIAHGGRSAGPAFERRLPGERDY